MVVYLCRWFCEQKLERVAMRPVKEAAGSSVLPGSPGQADTGGLRWCLPLTDGPHRAPYQSGLCEALCLHYSNTVVFLNHFGGLHIASKLDGTVFPSEKCVLQTQSLVMILLNLAASYPFSIAIVLPFQECCKNGTLQGHLGGSVC